MDKVTLISYVSAGLFFLAVLHTFLTKHFDRLAHGNSRHAGVWHLLGEVEVVFGFWALILLIAIAIIAKPDAAIHYLDSQNFTEPLFVFVILVIAGTRPILYFAKKLVDIIVRIMPLHEPLASYLSILILVPLLGSFITEPAAMTLAALMLRDRFYNKNISSNLKYVTLGVLFVNVSIGGVLTPYAAPPILIVASKWGWDMSFMISTFGYKAIIAVCANAILATMFFARELIKLQKDSGEKTEVQPTVPFTVICVHLIFLAGTVLFSHHPAVFMWLFLFFLGYTEAYKKHQDPLMLREGLLVGFFLAGLVVLGGKQQWWLQPVLSGMNDFALFIGATGLTAVTDNAALTYLGSLVESITESGKYALVAGAVTGGGLTVIANAPNPAGYSILSDSFKEGSINPIGHFLAALIPTLIAGLCFWLL